MESVSPIVEPNDDEIRRAYKIARYHAYRLSHAAYGTHLTPEDLAQEGVIGFLRSWRKYQPGVREQENYAKTKIAFAVKDAIDMYRGPTRYHDCLSLDEGLDGGGTHDFQGAEGYMFKQFMNVALGLPNPLNEVMRLMYLEGYNLRETGEYLGFSEARACQVHTQAIKILRKKLLTNHTVS